MKKNRLICRRHPHHKKKRLEMPSFVQRSEHRSVLPMNQTLESSEWGFFSWRFFFVCFSHVWQSATYYKSYLPSNLDSVQYVYIDIYIHKAFDSEQSYLSIQLTILKTKQPGKNNLGLKFKFLKTCCKTYNVSVTIHPPNPEISDPGVWNQVTNPSFHSSEWLMGHPKKGLIKGYNLNYIHTAYHFI